MGANQVYNATYEELQEWGVIPTETEATCADGQEECRRLNAIVDNTVKRVMLSIGHNNDPLDDGIDNV